MNTAITVSYDGTRYGGFQLQKNAVTVQEKLEKALFKIYKKEIRVISAGRTDAGVHARGQAVNFKAEPLIPTERIPAAFNSCLPRDIVVWEARRVPDSFHSNHHAVKKTYSYTIDIARFPRVFWRLYSWHCPFPLDISLMGQGCRILEGKHDFQAFQALGSGVKGTARTIFRAKITEDRENRLIRLWIEGDGFLYKMVRLITGSLVQIGKGRLELEKLEQALKGSDKKIAPALPAKGLCLERVDYGS